MGSTAERRISHEVQVDIAAEVPLPLGKMKGTDLQVFTSEEIIQTQEMIHGFGNIPDFGCDFIQCGYEIKYGFFLCGVNMQCMLVVEWVESEGVAFKWGSNDGCDLDILNGFSQIFPYVR